MQYIELPDAEYLNSVFKYDRVSGKLYWKKRVANCVTIGSEAGWKSRKYLQVTLNGTHYYVHRIIWKMVCGTIPNNKQIEHNDRNRLNNAWHNLKLVDQSTNMRNQSLPINNSSGTIGVSKHVSGLWVGSITKNKKRETTYHQNFEDAVAWRKSKEIEYKFHVNHGT